MIRLSTGIRTNFIDQSTGNVRVEVYSDQEFEKMKHDQVVDNITLNF